MAGGIDTSNRKPRRLRGTPALRYINKLSVATLVISCGVGYFFYTRPSTSRIENDFFSDESIAEANREREERSFLLNNQFIGQKSSSEIRQILRHKKKYDTER